jgi:hypothetical protein
VIPRIMPSNGELQLLRNTLDAGLTSLLNAPYDIEVDNAPPAYSGFSTGFHLLFHGMPSAETIAIKTKLFRVYSTMCPALLLGHFIERPRPGYEQAYAPPDVPEHLESKPESADNTPRTIADQEKQQQHQQQHKSSPHKSPVPSPAPSSGSIGSGPSGSFGFNSRLSPTPTIPTSPTGSTAGSSHNPTAGMPTAAILALGKPVPFASRSQQPVVGAGAGAGGGIHEGTSTSEAQTKPAVSGVSAAVFSEAPAAAPQHLQQQKHPSLARKKVRIGFLSRFLTTHPVGLLTQGIVSLLRYNSSSSGCSGTDYQNITLTKSVLAQEPNLEVFWTDHQSKHYLPRVVQALKAQQTSSAGVIGPDAPPVLDFDIEVVVFLVDGGKGTAQYDRVQRRILRDAHMAYVLPSQHIGASAQAVRNAKIDILVFPEVGLDPLTYFLSYARLAPVQVAWLGHPDTTAVPNIDYFLSSHMEPEHAHDNYTEKLYKLPFFGTQFVDNYAALAHLQLTAPRTILLNRAKYNEKLEIPTSAHLYVIAHSLCKLNPLFDEVLLRILMQDRYIF